MREKRDKREAELSEMASLAKTWKDLMEHPGWALYEMFMREQQSLRAHTVMMTPIAGEFTIYAQEYFKGEYGGIALSLSTPSAQFEQADLRRKVLTKELEIEDEVEAQLAAGESGSSRVVTDDSGAFGE